MHHVLLSLFYGDRRVCPVFVTTGSLKSFGINRGLIHVRMNKNKYSHRLLCFSSLKDNVDHGDGWPFVGHRTPRRRQINKGTCVGQGTDGRKLVVVTYIW